MPTWATHSHYGRAQGAQRLMTHSRSLTKQLDSTSHAGPALLDRVAPISRDAQRDVARIVRGLRLGAGHVVVTAVDVDRAEDLVEAAIASADPFRVLRVSATTDGLALAGDVLAFAADSGPGVRHARDKASSPIAGLIAEARAAGRPIVVVVADADLASVKRLEALRIQLDCAPGAIEAVRMVLIGCPVLSRILELPSARGLSSRVGMQVRVGEPRRRRR